MPFREGMALIEEAEEHERRDRLYRHWLALLPNMTKDNYVTFDNFYEEHTRPRVDLRPKDEIMNEIYGRR